MHAATQQIRFCTSHDGVRLAYATAGRGAPIVKAANWLNHLEFDWESPVWRHLLAELTRQHRLIRYDERGCGLSDWNAAEFSFEAWLQDLETVVDNAGADRFALLGISQGASIAIAYAVRHPERVSHLVLHGGYARGRLRRGVGVDGVEEAKLTVRLAEIGWGQENAAFRQFFATEFLPDGTPEQHRWFNDLARITTSPQNAGRFLRVFYDIDVTALLPKVACPTLVLHPTRDMCVPFDEGRLLASSIPGARFVPLESNHHLLLDTEPAWQRMCAELRAFLPAATTLTPRFESLTLRERELIELMAQGCDNAQIAAHMMLSDKTVRNHITSVFAKLQVENRAQAIVLARKAGFGGE
jgi:pimeloyl-ACP methyl ester carboxylesterase/DNA-binding CsgD family transcriptional regulator